MKIQEYKFSSNGLRLSWQQWIVTGILVLAAMYFLPVTWQRMENIQPAANYRLPYQLSDDYWLYEQLSRSENSAERILVVGDSVIWGHYVPKQETLSAHLNEIISPLRFANFGLDGAHPAAMYGLMKYYTKNLPDRKIVLHLNPLWFTSPKHDLQTDKEYDFNHPELVAQFIPEIPCYTASFSKRLKAVLRRYLPVVDWVSHLNITYYNSMDMPRWTVDNPYKNPFGSSTLLLREEVYEHPAAKDSITDINRQDNYQWIELAGSVQWWFFRETIVFLQKGNNQLFVIVGPFNEHRLTGDNLDEYTKLKQDIASWFEQNNIDYLIPSVLPADLYVDASHPTGEGYALLAQQLCENQSFMQFISREN